MNGQELSIHGLQAMLSDGEKLCLLDVREAEELENGVIDGAIHIPMGSIPERMRELDVKSRFVVICRTGNRSRKVAQYLTSNGFEDVLNLSEGMNGWAKEIDTKMSVY